MTVVSMGSAKGGGGEQRDGVMVPSNQKVGDIISNAPPPPPNHDGSAVTVIIPALKRALYFHVCLFLAGSTARSFHHWAKKSIDIFLSAFHGRASLAFR